MHADSSGVKGTGLLLALALLSNACVSLTPPPGPGRSLRYTPRGTTGPAVARGTGEMSPLVLDETVWQSALAAHLAFRKGVGEVSGSTRCISGELSRLKASYSGIAGVGNGIFVGYVDYGERQLRWIDAELAAATVVLKESMEALPLLSALKFTLPALRAAAPVTLGVGLRVGPNGVMMGTRMVVSAEWVEMMRQLVRAGVLSLPAVSAAVRIQAGHVMMAQGHGELPRGVREALGDAPEVRAMHVTGKTGAGMAEPPRHHIMPNEFREWFEKRGFTGKMSIEWFCVTLQQAHHQAIHGGGDWKLGRKWPGEWNRMLMDALRKAESKAGRMLTRNEVLDIVAENMSDYRIPMNFVRCRGK